MYLNEMKRQQCTAKLWVFMDEATRTKGFLSCVREEKDVFVKVVKLKTDIETTEDDSVESGRAFTWLIHRGAPAGSPFV